jgi:pyruvate kinase
VANAIMDGTDAVMLSEETAVGRYPVESVQMMDRLARDAEEAEERRDALEDQTVKLRHEEAVALAAAQLAEQIDAAAIITCTQSGSTTRLVSKRRPRIPLLALTPDKRTFRELALVWGAIPLLMDAAAGAETMERQALQSAMRAGLVREGDVVVITAGLPLHVPGTTNTVKVAVAGRDPCASSARSSPA